MRRSFRYAAIVRRAVVELESVKRRLWAGPELRASVFGSLNMQRRKDVDKARKGMEARIVDSPLSATAHAVRGELAAALAAIAAPADVPALRFQAEASFVEALRLLGRDDRGEAIPSAPPTAEPALGPRDAARECFVALRGLGLLLLRSEGMAEAARVRLLSAKEAGRAAGLDDAALNVDAALADVAGAERTAVAGAIAGAGAGGGNLTWYTCPNGHRYAVGECGAGMELSRCPDCGERIGGQNHAMAAGNAAIGAPSPYAVAALAPPPEDLIRRLQLA